MRTVSFTHTDVYTLTSRLSLFVYTDVHKFTTPTRPPPWLYVSRRYPRPLYVTPTPFTTQHRYHAQVSLVCLSFVSLMTGFRLHPPSPAPRLHRPPASGRRVSSHLFPRAYLRVPVI